VKPQLAQRLHCPVCAGTLRAARFDDETTESVAAGILTCDPCRTWYPIVNHVPVLLDYAVPLHRAFEAEHAARLAAVPALHAPQGLPRPGELLTQRSFTAEWKAVRQDGELNFMSTRAERRERMRLELDWPSGLLDRGSGVALDVGCGNGVEAVLLQEVTGGEVFAVDLNLELIASGAWLAEQPHVYPVVASVFALPFAGSRFDLIYSSGVLHHTYSTRRAFDTVVSLLGDEAAVYLWLYANEDASRTVRGRLNYLLELAVRPALATVPAPVQTAVVQPLAAVQYARHKRAGPNRDRWQYANSLHTVRDRWTCRYAHRHSFHEVMSWFIEHGLDFTFVDPIAFERTLGFPIFGIGIRGARGAATAQPPRSVSPTGR
jgi:uncharacterized protein YbaR (Trm112 family)